MPLIGRRIEEVDGWNSSDALRSLDGVWTRDSLARFLADPQGFAPGTTMGAQGLSGSEAAAGGTTSPTCGARRRAVAYSTSGVGREATTCYSVKRRPRR